MKNLLLTVEVFSSHFEWHFDFYNINFVTFFAPGVFACVGLCVGTNVCMCRCLCELVRVKDD